MVDSAETTARETETRLAALDLFNPAPRSAFHFLTTDAPERFARVAGYFLSDPPPPESPELVAL
jgi:hypothetical protein